MTSSSPTLVPVPASPGKRVATLLIDLLGAALVAFVASTLSHRSAAIIATILVEYAAVEAIMIASRGRSFGSTLTRSALVTAGSASLSPSLGRAFGYVLLTAVSSIVLPVPFVSVLLGGERGSWMASLCSLQCITFAPSDEHAEASAPSSPYSNARARSTGGYSNFASVTAPVPADRSAREPQAADQPHLAAPQGQAPAIAAPMRAMPQAPSRPITPTAPAQTRPPIGQASAQSTPTPPGAPPAPVSTPTAPAPPARPARAQGPSATPVTSPTRRAPAAPPVQAGNPSAPRPTPTEPTAPAPVGAAYAGLLLDTGQSIPVDRTIVLGRAPSPVSPGDYPIPVDDQTRSLSRTHVRVSPTATGITIIDMNSANGTRARTPNGRTHTLVPGQPLELPINSQLLLGERLISVVDLRQRR